MKKFFIILFFISSFIFGQSFKFAWISNINIGSDSTISKLDSLVSQINSKNFIKFVLVSGNITLKGSNKELEKAKEILDKLKIPYHIIPGINDTQWSQSGGTKFSELWNDNKFSFSFNNEQFIGINSSIIWQKNTGHFSVEDLDWLKNQIDTLSNKKSIYFITYFPLDSSIDNWFKVSNLLRTKNIRAIFAGNGKKNSITNFNGIPFVKTTPSINQNKKNFGFTLVNDTADSLIFYHIKKDTLPEYYGTISKSDSLRIPEIDSTNFINYDVNIKWKYNLKTTLIAPLLVWHNKIYAADKSGIVTCFDINGNVLWTYNTFGNITGRPAIKDNILVVATLQGDLITINATTGAQIQTIGFDEAITSQLVIIKYNGKKQLMIPKMTKSKAAVVFSTSSGKIYCYNLATLEQIWENKNVNGMVSTLPLYVNNKLIFGAWDGYLYNIDAKEGWIIWGWRNNKNFYDSPADNIPVTDGKAVYIATPDGYAVKIDLLLGTTLWETNKYHAYSSIGISQNEKMLYIKGSDGNFYTVPTKYYKAGLTYKINFGNDYSPSVPIQQGKNIFFSTQKGDIYRISGRKKYKKILFMGTSTMHSIQLIKNNLFAASNLDGKIVVFEFKK